MTVLFKSANGLEKVKNIINDSFEPFFKPLGRHKGRFVGKINDKLINRERFSNHNLVNSRTV
jgi:hypothetical protein